MLDITLVAVGKIKDKNYRAAAEEYIKRLRPYAKLKVIELAPAPFSLHNQERAKEIEGKRIKEFLASRTGPVWLLAERGKVFTSPDFAAFMEKKQPLILIMGGALGFSADLYQKYPPLSLSPLTFPHELARVVLLEQLYRAATILNKKDYHY
jgi:23S rRNA (pseudouridine1915-N3)-methyltransferase